MEVYFPHKGQASMIIGTSTFGEGDPFLCFSAFRDYLQFKAETVRFYAIFMRGYRWFFKLIFLAPV